jgi:hypothetical protein
VLAIAGKLTLKRMVKGFAGPGLQLEFWCLFSLRGIRMPPMEFESMFEFTLEASSRMPLIMVLIVSWRSRGRCLVCDR